MLKRVSLLFTAFLLIAPASVFPEEPAPGTLTLWVDKEFNSWDNPLSTELSINGKTLNIYTSDTFEPVASYFKEGWNTVTIKTTPQEPANKNNGLIFRIGPASKDPSGTKMVMNPVLWEFRNGTDWQFKDGAFSHPLGPDVKEVSLTYNLYYVPAPEPTQIKAGDYVLVGKPGFKSWNSPVVATVFVNGTPFNSFMLSERQIVVTPLLKEGKNEIKLVSYRVKNSIKNNDVKVELMGPAEWNVSQNKFVLNPILKADAIQGWKLEPKSGVLSNPLKPDAEMIERVIPFFLKTAP